MAMLLMNNGNNKNRSWKISKYVTKIDLDEINIILLFGFRFLAIIFTYIFSAALNLALRLRGLFSISPVPGTTIFRVKILIVGFF